LIDEVRVLLIEDSDEDAELVLGCLARGGLELSSRRVNSEADLIEALRSPWDVVLSGFEMPGFGGMEGLACVRERAPDVPFIFVSAALEEAAVEAMRVGARDYVLKSNLSRLPAVVARELAEARNRKRRESLEAQVVAAQRMEVVGRLAGGIAHDFNNVLTIIDSYSGFLLEALRDQPALAADVEVIKDAGKRAAGLTAQLLAFSRRQVATLQMVDINALVGELVPMLRTLIGEDVRVAMRLAPDLGIVEVDPTHVEQIVLNLAVNARDAMPDGGELTIETTNLSITRGDTTRELTPGDYVAIAVRDTGSGIDAAMQLEIFEPFYTTKPQGHGTGLGLSTVYGIAKQARGGVWVDSEVGRGATFTVCFPRRHGAATPRRNSPGPELEPRSPTTLLLVEDEEFVRRGTRRILERAGYTVLEAADGRAALGICRAHQGAIDLMVTDIVMPGMNGRQLAEQARDLLPSLRTLYVSGYTSDVAITHGVLQAGTSYLQKPFTRQQLLEKVLEVLDAPLSD
jgi:signal transduction histidine kinase